MIMTVKGEISPDELGVCSAHEHMFINTVKCDIDLTGNEPKTFFEPFTAQRRYEITADPYAVCDNAILDDFAIATKEMIAFKNAGGNTIIDCTLDEIGRDAVKLKKLSEQSGVNIVMGCGHYYKKAHFDYVKEATVKQLTDELIKDITVGVSETGIKAGIIGEIGTSEVVYPEEKKTLIAAARASVETGKAIHVHTDLYTENGEEIIDIITQQGVKPEKICIDHVDVVIREDYIQRLLDRGAYVEFDNFGKEYFLSLEHRFAYDLERIYSLKKLIDKGYKSNILLSNDICLKSMLREYGGNGYEHLLKTVMKMATDVGIPKETYLEMLSDNVKNFME